jgi:hypothetical protein
MKFAEAVSTFIASGQATVWVRTNEPTEAALELASEWSAKMAKPPRPAVGKTPARPGIPYAIYRWSLLTGLTDPTGKTVTMASEDGFGGNSFAGSPAGMIAAVRHMAEFAQGSVKDTALFVLIVENFQRMADEHPAVQAVHDFFRQDRTQNAFALVLLAHFDQQVPNDMKSYVAIVDHALPDLETLIDATSNLLEASCDEENPEWTEQLKSLTADERKTISQAGMGLSRLQFETELMFSLTAIKLGFATGTDCGRDLSFAEALVYRVQDRKAAVFNAEGLIRLEHAAEKEEDVAGFEGLKALVKRRFGRAHERYYKGSNPRGLLLVGPPGTAKSTMAKALGSILGRITAFIDPGSLKQGVVGASEGRIRRMFQILNAMGEIDVFIDEIEKVFPTGNELDSGVSADALGVWLTNLADPTRKYYVIASANQVTKLPAPLLRNGRFDHLVMVDMPSPKQQAAIWTLLRKKFGIPPEEPTPPHADWTGAEIFACCEQADALGVTLAEAARRIVPIMVTAPDSVRQVREYAHHKAIDSETGLPYVNAATRSIDLSAGAPAPSVAASVSNRRGSRGGGNPSNN